MRYLLLLIVFLTLLYAMPAKAFVLTFEDVSRELEKCEGKSTSEFDTVKGETYAFIKSSIMEGSANILTFRSILTLTRGAWSDDNNYEILADCATERVRSVLMQAGVRIIENISGLDAEFKNKNVAFFPTLFFESIWGYQLIRVRKDYATIIRISNVTCNASFSVVAVAYPLDSLQPSWGPSQATEKSITGEYEATFTYDSPEVLRAIDDTSDQISYSDWIKDKQEYQKSFQDFIMKNRNELWFWVGVSSNDKACSALMSVRERRFTVTEKSGR